MNPGGYGVVCDADDVEDLEYVNDEDLEPYVEVRLLRCIKSTAGLCLAHGAAAGTAHCMP